MTRGGVDIGGMLPPCREARTELSAVGGSISGRML
eukprot:CAMPEP_0173467324 /NCGR_PEP_ID=MMETSP1357-20121228/74859_1 /TAXON_ID=77926 /ORGANISM="Hemiselmis rufescens, Strain PCC563" /LENGTH=34 /DNA_ID= /DNA_START= /DNA_END= /DNA_ORIENTATION=